MVPVKFKHYILKDNSPTIDLCASFSKLNPSAKISLNLFRISLCLAISVDKIHLKNKKDIKQLFIPLGLQRLRVLLSVPLAISLIDCQSIEYQVPSNVNTLVDCRHHFFLSNALLSTTHQLLHSCQLLSTLKWSHWLSCALTDSHSLSSTLLRSYRLSCALTDVRQLWSASCPTLKRRVYEPENIAVVSRGRHLSPHKTKSE